MRNQSKIFIAIIYSFLLSNEVKGHMVKQFSKKDQYIALYVEGDGFNNPQAVCELFDFSDELLLEIVQELKSFVKKVLDRSEITSFGNPISSSEEREFWHGIGQISMPTIFARGLVRNLENLNFFHDAPENALKAFATIEMLHSKSDIDIALHNRLSHFPMLPLTLMAKSLTLMAKRKNFLSMAFNVKPGLIRSSLHPYIAFKFLCTDDELALFNQRQQNLRREYDVRIENARARDKSYEDMARDFNCSAHNVFDYIQTRSSLMQNNDIEIRVENLNFVPFVMSALQNGFGKASSRFDSRDSLILVTASLASKLTGLDITIGRVKQHLARSLTPSTKAEVDFAISSAIDSKLIPSKAMKASKVRISDTHGAAVEARTLAQRSVRKGFVGHTGGRAGLGAQKPK